MKCLKCGKELLFLFRVGDKLVTPDYCSLCESIMEFENTFARKESLPDYQLQQVTDQQDRLRAINKLAQLGITNHDIAAAMVRAGADFPTEDEE